MNWLHAHLAHLRERLTTLHGVLFFSATAADIVFIVLGVYLVYRHERRKATDPAGFPGFWHYMLPKEVFLHKSALLDYQVKLLQSFIGFPFSLPGVIGVATIVTWTYHGGLVVLGPAQPTSATPLWLLLCCGGLIALAFDFGNYSGHVLQHKVPLFWEFHKVHHAAEVLTPITVDRTHPMEDLPKIVITTLLCTTICVVFSRFYRIDVDSALLYGGDLLLWWRIILFFRLRHSHVPMFFPTWLTYVFLSPVHHQTHHSSLQRHFDSNYGLNLAVWDRLFGTHVPPEHPAQLRLGLSDGEQAMLNRNFLQMYLLPFRNAWFHAILRRERKYLSENASAGA